MKEQDLKNPQMDLRRLGEICAAYGQDSRRWPQQERASAEALVSGSAEARQLLLGAARLDQWLDREPPLPPSLALRTKILAAVPGRKPRNVPAFAFLPWLAVAGWRFAIPVLLVALVLGMALGGTTSPDTLEQADLLQLAVFQNDLDEY